MQREATPWGSIRSKAKEGGLEETPGVQMLFARKLLSILGKRGLEVAVSGSDAGGRVGLDRIEQSKLRVRVGLEVRKDGSVWLPVEQQSASPR